MTNPAVRKWLYGIACAVTLLVGAYGFIDDQLIAAWNMLAAAVFGVATLNTNTNQSSGRRAKVE
jgi:hypothetical protein